MGVRYQKQTKSKLNTHRQDYFYLVFGFWFVFVCLFVLVCFSIFLSCEIKEDCVEVIIKFDYF